jgi:hypothetical protein
VPVEPGGAPAEHEGRAARHVGHPAVEAVRTSGDRVHRDVLEQERVDAVLADLGIDHDDGHRGMTMLAEVEGAPPVTGEVADDQVAEGEVVANRLDEPMMPPE